jgi:amino acid adenylation domain-containing protein
MMEIEKIESSYPLSPLQQGLLFHSLYASQSGVYVQQLVCGLHERLDVASFERSWRKVIERHAVLRTSFRWEGLQQPVQDVHNQIDLPLEQLDWRGLPVSEQEERLRSFLQTDEQLGFELTRAPLMRLNLFRLAAADYRLVWTSHHALLDGRSRLLVLKELFAFYEAYCNGRELTLERPRPYRDYIDWLQEQNFDNAETFWRAALKDFTTPTPVIVTPDPERPPSHDQFEELRTSLSQHVTHDLQSVAQRNELTLNTLVQGAWALLLGRYSGENDIVFGVTRACRHSTLPEAESMVGLFINTLPVRVRLVPEMSLLSWLKALRAQHIALREFEHTALMKIHEWSETPRGVQLFDSLLVFENYQLNSTLRGLGGDWRNREFQLFERTNYPLTIAGYAGAQLSLKISYNRRHFDEETITRMLGHLRTLLEGIAADPSRPLSSLEILTPAERNQILLEWNETRTDYPRELCLHELFEAHARRTPETVAVVCEGEEISYGELNRRADKLARFLRQNGVATEQPVGLLMERSVDMIVGQLGVLKAGGAYLPLDPDYPHDRLAFMVQDAAVSILLTHERLGDRVPETEAMVIFMDTEWAVMPESGAEDSARHVDADNLAYVMYTSGSTGRPKGVMISHRAICNHLLWRQSAYPLTPGDRFLHKAPFVFDISVWEIFGTLMAGARLIMARPGGQQDFEYIVKLMSTDAVTVAHFSPAALEMFLDTKGSDSCHLLRSVFCGGDVLSNSLQERFFSRLGARLQNQYGPTETTVDVTVWDCEPGSSRNQVPIGYPIANTQAYILDSSLRPVPVGVPGELHIGGTSLARGYLGRPDLTAEKFIPHPFSIFPGARLYKTGDLARFMPGREIEFLGRIDNQVKLRGFRIELGEIESVLGAHPFVKQAVVLVTGRESNLSLVAYVVPEDGQVLSVSQLRRYVLERLPEYMVPQVFVMLPRLPLLPNGKIDRRALPAPEQERPQLDHAYTAARNSTEKTIAAIWTELLPVQTVGVHDNFFELGGHSLLAMRLISRLRETMKVDVPLELLFKAPTVAGLAEIIEASESPGEVLVGARVTKIPSRENIPLSLEQEAWLLREWWEKLYSVEKRLFHTSAAYRLRGPLNVTALERALNEIIRRHQVLRSTFPKSNGLLTLPMISPVLRTIFSRQGVQKKLYDLTNKKPLNAPQPGYLGSPRQRIMPAMLTNIPAIDLRQVAGSERESDIQRLLARELTQPFDYAKGPMLRALLIRLAEEEYVLSIVAHHLVFDGWSMNVFNEELAILYGDFLKGATPTLPEPSLQYGDFAWWQREWLQGEVLEKLLAYWREQFEGTDLFPELNLPFANSEPLGSDFHLSGEIQDRVLPPQLFPALQELSNRHGVTLFMLLMAALKVLLHRYTNKERIGLFTPFANRGREELEHMIGWVAHVHVLTTRLSPDMRFSDLLQRVRKTVLGAYAHQEIPYTLLLRKLLPEMENYDLPGKIFEASCVIFDFRRQSNAPLEIPGLNVTQLDVPHNAVDAGIEVILIEQGDSLTIRIKYSRQRFDRARVGQMLVDFQRLLESVVANSEQRLSDLSIGNS